jgi:hypothetical protein
MQPPLPHPSVSPLPSYCTVATPACPVPFFDQLAAIARWIVPRLRPRPGLRDAAFVELAVDQLAEEIAEPDQEPEP